MLRGPRKCTVGIAAATDTKAKSLRVQNSCKKPVVATPIALVLWR